MAGTIDLPSPTDGERRASPGSAWLDPPRWAYDVPGSRDRRLDFLRGFLVAAMVVDHVGGESLLTRLSGNNAFLVSAAEGFVFISGLLMGIVYGGRMTKLGLRAGMEGVLRRVGRLHITIALLTFTFVLIYLYTELSASRQTCCRRPACICWYWRRSSCSSSPGAGWQAGWSRALSNAAAR